MQNEDLKEMKRYLKPALGSLPLGAALLVLAIAGASVAANALGLILLVGLLVAVCCWRDAVLWIRWLEYVSEDGQSPERAQQLKDYVQGFPMLEDSVRVGEKYLVGRKGTIPVAIEDVAQVYEYEHRTNFMVDHRAVIVLTKSGEKQQLCSFPLKDVTREDKLLLFAAIKQKNPSVKLGYK